MPLADPVRIGLSEFQSPKPNRLVADVDAAFGQEILNIPLAHREPEVEPNRVLDNVGVKAVASIRDILHRANLPPDRAFHAELI